MEIKTYLDYCKERCEWCAKGLPSFGTGRNMRYHIIGGIHDADGISGGESERCTAPSHKALIAELSEQIEAATKYMNAAIQRAETAKSLRDSAAPALEDQVNTNAALKQALASHADEIQRLKEALQSAGATLDQIFSATRTNGLDYGYHAIANLAQKESAAINDVLAVKP